MIKFYSDNYETEITISSDREDQTVDEMFEMFESFLLALGYSPETINSYLHDKEELKEY